MRAIRWSSAELECLEGLVGNLPYPEVLEQYAHMARAMGWPPRTVRAIEGRIKRSGQRQRASNGDCLTTCGAAELLGCSCARVERWLHQPRISKILQPRWVGQIRYVQRSAWRRLAKNLPEVLGGFARENLFMLLEDRALADGVASLHPFSLGDYSLRCVETGRIYRNAKEAAHVHHVTSEAINRATRENRAVAAIGLTFVRQRCDCRH